MKISENTNNTPAKKVGRKSKHSQKITDEDLQNNDDGITTPKEIAEKHDIPVQSVHNKIHRRKQKLKIGFQNKQADPAVSNLETSPTINQEQQSPQDVNLSQGGVPLDATEALKGIWSLVDSMLSMASFLSKNQIEYTKLEQAEIDQLAQVCNQSPFMRKLATQEGLSALIIVGTVIAVFSRHVKLNLKKKHKKNDPKCECKDCEELRKLAKEELALQKEQANKQDINNVPPTAHDEPKQITNVPEGKDNINDNTPNNELLRQKVLDSTGFNETKEYTLPED